jgi:hypothetical protein
VQLWSAAEEIKGQYITQKHKLAWDLPTANYLIWHSAARGEKYHSKGTGTIKIPCI